MKMKPLHTDFFVFNPRDNGGEQVTLVTEFYATSDKTEVYTYQELTLNCYGKSVTFAVNGLFDPYILDQLSKQLKESTDKAKVIAALTNTA